MAALLALLSSVLWGTSDFLGGTLSRRISPYAVIAGSQGLALIGLAVLIAATGRYDDPGGYLPWAIAAGLVGLIALSAFYIALAAGTMGVVAPIAAAGVVLPFVVGLAQGDRPSIGQVVGACVTVLGVVLASGPEMRRGIPGGARPVVLAFVAAAGFGAALVFIAEGSKSSVPMTLLMMRAVSIVILGTVALTRRTTGGIVRANIPMLCVIGAFEVTANGAYAIATTKGLISLSAVLASLYPAVTVLLARKVHGERMRRVQDAGVALTMLGVVLVAS